MQDAFGFSVAGAVSSEKLLLVWNDLTEKSPLNSSHETKPLDLVWDWDLQLWLPIPSTHAKGRDKVIPTEVGSIYSQYAIEHYLQTSLADLKPEGTLCLVACIAYPFGWSNNSEISQICGPESGTYELGRCEVGWAYVLTIACGVISAILSGMPNILQSLLRRNTPPPPLPSSDAKYALLPPSYSHPHLLPPWNTMENSVFMGGIGGGGVGVGGGGGGGVNCYARRRPHSLVIPSDPSTLMDLTRRLSCSVFCPIPEQHQAGLPPTKPS
ncbi:LHFPL tetraspan subfamily member 6 protein, partial [Taenia solium]